MSHMSLYVTYDIICHICHYMSHMSLYVTYTCHYMSLVMSSVVSTKILFCQSNDSQAKTSCKQFTTKFQFFSVKSFEVDASPCLI